MDAQTFEEKTVLLQKRMRDRFGVAAACNEYGGQMTPEILHVLTGE